MIAKLVKPFSLVIAAIGIIVIMGITLPRPIWRIGAARAADATYRILVLSNEIHTDIAVPVEGEVLARFGFLRDAGLDLDNPGLRYIVFGWGGRTFYTETRTWADLKLVPVLKSFTIDRAVMHVELAGDIEANDPAVTIVAIDADGMGRLQQFILESFVEGRNGAIPLDYAYGFNDAFFEAKGYFNAFAGCNTWTAAGLREAGLSSGWWTALPWMLKLSLRLHNGSDVFASREALTAGP